MQLAWHSARNNDHMMDAQKGGVVGVDVPRALAL